MAKLNTKTQTIFFVGITALNYIKNYFIFIWRIIRSVYKLPASEED